MKTKLVREALNEEYKDYYPTMTRLAKEITLKWGKELDSIIKERKLAEDEIYNLYNRLSQWISDREDNTSIGQSYWGSGYVGPG